MTIRVTCQECSKVYTLKDDTAGKKFRCKECGEVVRIPARSKKKSATRTSGVKTSRPKTSPKRQRKKEADYDEYGSGYDDEYGNGDEYGDEYDNEYGDESGSTNDDDYDRPTRRSGRGRTQSKRKRKRKSSGSGWLNKNIILLTCAIIAGLFLILAIISIVSLPATAIIAVGIFFGALGLGWAIAMAGGIWGIVLAFQEDVACGLMSLFVPFYSLYYLITRFSEMWRSFALSLAGLGLILFGIIGSPLWGLTFGLFHQDEIRSMQEDLRSTMPPRP